MTSKLIAGIVAAGTLAIGATVAFAQPSQAQMNRRFVCQMDSSNIPTTYAQTPRGNVAVIKWSSSYFSGSGYTPMQRCQAVTDRFNTYDAKGQLQYMSSGWQNNQPVVCAGSACTGHNLLFTLRPDQDSAQVLQEMMANRTGAAGPSHQAIGGRPTYTVNVDKYLQVAPVESSGSSNVAPSNPSGGNSGGNVW